MLKERCNDAKLKKAGAYLQRDFEMLCEILEISSEEEAKNHTSLYLAMHYQFKGKLYSRHLDQEACVANYKVCEDIFMRAYKGERSLIMQSFYQFAVDDFAELGLEERAMELNKLYKKTL